MAVLALHSVTQLVLDRIPSDVSPIIRSFLALTRHDWRTCRKHEADLVSRYNRWTKRVLDDDALDWYCPGVLMLFPIMFSQNELDVYLNEWTLFGRWYIISLTRDNIYWHLERRVIYHHVTENYKKWYMDECLMSRTKHRVFH